MIERNSPTNLVNANVIASILGVTPQTVRLWGRQGRIPCHRITAKTVRYSPGEVYRAVINDPRRKPRASARPRPRS